jgi:hypothetical protein
MPLRVPRPALRLVTMTTQRLKKSKESSKFEALGLDLSAVPLFQPVIDRPTMAFLARMSESLTGWKSQTSTPPSNWRGMGFNRPWLWPCKLIEPLPMPARPT